MSSPPSLPQLPWANSALRDLPTAPHDPERGPRAVRGAFFVRTPPTPLASCELVAESRAVTRDMLQLPPQFDDKTLAHYFGGGGGVLDGSEVAAHAYCGHQFGHFAGQLGDGRALYLGELHGYELQLKGGGLTPFSRSADGRAVLRSSIREFLCSEAMAALGIPTTRAGVLGVSQSDTVERDRNYDGNVKDEPAAVVLRVASSFIRFGSFQICNPVDGDREGPSVGLDEEMLLPLLEHVVSRRYPHIVGDDADERYVQWFGELVEQTAELVAQWQSVGFCHGVLNTDNLSAVGVTIDYGPFGFMERFDRRYVCNSSDTSARYCYEAQPAICKWNLGKLAEALERVLPRARLDALIGERFDAHFARAYRRLMRAKLGLDAPPADAPPADAAALDAADDALAERLLDAMQRTASDYTNTFRALAAFEPADGGGAPTLAALLAGCGSAEARAAPHRPSVSVHVLRQLVLVAQENPLALYMYGKSPDWLRAELARRERYAALLAAGTDAAADRELWRDWLAAYAARLARVRGAGARQPARGAAMDAVNPKYVLRNWVAERAIRAAEDRGDYALVRRLLAVLAEPYRDHGSDVEQFCAPAALDELDALCVSCSS